MARRYFERTPHLATHGQGPGRRCPWLTLRIASPRAESPHSFAVVYSTQSKQGFYCLCSLVCSCLAAFYIRPCWIQASWEKQIDRLKLILICQDSQRLIIIYIIALNWINALQGDLSVHQLQLFLDRLYKYCAKANIPYHLSSHLAPPITPHHQCRRTKTSPANHHEALDRIRIRILRSPYCYCISNASLSAQ